MTQGIPFPDPVLRAAGKPATWFRTLGGLLAASFCLVWTVVPLRAQDPPKVPLLNKANAAFKVSIADSGAGKVEVRLLGTGNLLGTLAKASDTVTVPADKFSEFTFVADGANPFARDIKIAQTGPQPGWAWFRAQKPAAGKPFVLQREGAFSSSVVYDCNTDLATTITLRVPTPEEQAKAATALQQFALVNSTTTPVYFAVNEVADVLGLITFLPPNPAGTDGFVNENNGSLLPGVQNARQVGIQVNKVKKTAYQFNILIGDADNWRDIVNMAQIERFKVGFSQDQPFRVEPAPFKTTTKMFKNIKFVLDDSNPEYPVLKVVNK